MDIIPNNLPYPVLYAGEVVKPKAEELITQAQSHNITASNHFDEF